MMRLRVCSTARTIVATLKPDGGPQTSVVQVKRECALYFSRTTARRQKACDLVRDPRIRSRSSTRCATSSASSGDQFACRADRAAPNLARLKRRSPQPSRQCRPEPAGFDETKRTFLSRRCCATGNGPCGLLGQWSSPTQAKPTFSWSAVTEPLAQSGPSLLNTSLALLWARCWSCQYARDIRSRPTLLGGRIRAKPLVGRSSI